MSQIDESIASFLDAISGELQRSLAGDPPEQITISWSQNQPDADVPDLVWWSCALSVDPACRIYVAANREVWRAIGGASTVEAGGDDPQTGWFAVLTQSIERAAKARFGALVSCTELGISEESPGAWARFSVAINRPGSGSPAAMRWVLSPELMVALGGEAAGPSDANRVARMNKSAAANPLDILQHVEIPVSVSFGRTQMRLKDLLGLANGSVVHLDRELGDEVEVRVNNRVIARGEVVAVDGNYGVRILEMVSGDTAGKSSSQNVRGALRGA
jgi:flagellar motor switch protein FliN/FliY